MAMSRLAGQRIVLLLLLQLALAPVSAVAQAACATQTLADQPCPSCPAESCNLQVCGLYCGATALIPVSSAFATIRISLSPLLQRVESLPSPVYTPLNPPPIR